MRPSGIGIGLVALALLLLPRLALGAPPEGFEADGDLRLDSSIPAPGEVFGYEIGTRYTRHGPMLGYLRQLAEASDRVVLRPYGRSVEGRELVHLFISAPDNIARLDDILERNRLLADPSADEAQRADVIENNPAVAYFSYCVHGNEASCTEAAIQLAYTLGAARSDDIAAMLRDVVLVVDPLLNPDGRERYVHWFQMVRGATPDPNPHAAEHHEPWPGGRTNHYYFDLNRDWLWLVQPESRQRLRAYRDILPQLHIDHHEQGYQQPFFFGAGDEPYNVNIPAETRQWIERYGEANAAAFDAEALVYSTKERFDYLYPGYGKVLPVYHGAVGMLAEKGGHSRAGVAIHVADDYTLTLRERAAHHFKLSLSNLRFTAENRRGQLERFGRFFDDAAGGTAGGLQYVVVSPDNDPVLLARLWDLCHSHGIEIRTATTSGPLDLHRYDTGARETVRLPTGSWVIDTRQPMGNLVRAIFERDTVVTDIETYDITAWTVPIVLGLDAWYAADVARPATAALETWDVPAGEVRGEGDVALLVDAGQHGFPQAIAAAVRHELFARIAGEAFTLDGTRYSRGSLIVHLVRNDPQRVAAAMQAMVDDGLTVTRADRGLTEDGPVLGANANDRLVRPSVLLLRGDVTSANSFGQHWHMLDVASPFPHTVITQEALGRTDLRNYNTLVIPDLGDGIDAVITAEHKRKLERWIDAGGVVIATGAAARWAHRELLDVDTLTFPATAPSSRETFAERRQRRMLASVRGALVRVKVDPTHPLTAGVPETLGVLKRSSDALNVRGDGEVIAYYDDDSRIGGVISDDRVDEIAGGAFMTRHRVGRGAVICFSDDVTFRGYGLAGQRLLLNAIAYGTSH